MSILKGESEPCRTDRERDGRRKYHTMRMRGRFLHGRVLRAVGSVSLADAKQMNGRETGAERTAGTAAWCGGRDAPPTDRPEMQGCTVGEYHFWENLWCGGGRVESGE